MDFHAELINFVRFVLISTEQWNGCWKLLSKIWRQIRGDETLWRNCQNNWLLRDFDFRLVKVDWTIIPFDLIMWELIVFENWTFRSNHSRLIPGHDVYYIAHRVSGPRKQERILLVQIRHLLISSRVYY